MPTRTIAAAIAGRYVPNPAETGDGLGVGGLVVGSGVDCTGVGVTVGCTVGVGAVVGLLVGVGLVVGVGAGVGVGVDCGFCTNVAVMFSLSLIVMLSVRLVLLSLQLWRFQPLAGAAVKVTVVPYG